MLIRRELPTDADAIRAVHLAAFAEPATQSAPARDGAKEARLVEELRADGDLVLPCCLVAEVDGVVAGHVAVSRASVDGEVALVALGPIGVLPQVQGLGVGSALMHATLAAADALGERAVVLLGHPTYYPRFGFTPAVDHGIVPPQDWGAQYFLLRPLHTWGDGVSGAFRYAPAFERLDG